MCEIFRQQPIKTTSSYKKRDALRLEMTLNEDTNHFENLLSNYQQVFVCTVNLTSLKIKYKEEQSSAAPATCQFPSSPCGNNNSKRQHNENHHLDSTHHPSVLPQHILFESIKPQIPSYIHLVAFRYPFQPSPLPSTQQQGRKSSPSKL